MKSREHGVCVPQLLFQPCSAKDEGTKFFYPAKHNQKPWLAKTRNHLSTDIWVTSQWVVKSQLPCNNLYFFRKIWCDKGRWIAVREKEQINQTTRSPEKKKLSQTKSGRLITIFVGQTRFCLCRSSDLVVTRQLESCTPIWTMELTGLKFMTLFH